MGEFDIYCFLCGNPAVKFDIDEFLDFIDEHGSDSDNTKQVNKFVAKSKKDSQLIIKLKAFAKSTEWLEYCTFLTFFNINISGCSVDSGTHFISGQDVELIQEPGYDANLRKNSITGVFAHNDCHAFIKKMFGIELQLKHLPVGKFNKGNAMRPFPINQGEIKKYQKQFFDFLGVFMDNKEYLCKSPLQSSANAKQIIKNFNALKIKPGRMGPESSATWYPDGTYKLGANNNIWRKSRGKWVPIKEKTELFQLEFNKVPKPIEKNLRYAGESANLPFFITHVSGNKVQFLSTEVIFNKFKKLLF